MGGGQGTRSSQKEKPPRLERVQRRQARELWAQDETPFHVTELGENDAKVNWVWAGASTVSDEIDHFGRVQLTQAPSYPTYWLPIHRLRAHGILDYSS